MKLVRKSGPPTGKERREWLKQEHGLGTNPAQWIAERAAGKGAETDDPDAYLRAAEETRIDLGFALGARKAEGRLIDTGGYARTGSPTGFRLCQAAALTRK